MIIKHTSTGTKFEFSTGLVLLYNKKEDRWLLVKGSVFSLSDIEMSLIVSSVNHIKNSK